MEFKIYNSLPQEAVDIRTAVFVNEQGFRHEFDETDKTALHIVAFKDGQAAGVCRIFPQNDNGAYILGRLAVLKECRLLHIGRQLIEYAEHCIRKRGGKSVCLHAQVRVKEFYEKQGYRVCSAIDSEDSCPHVWMRKTLEA